MKKAMCPCGGRVPLTGLTEPVVQCPLCHVYWFVAAHPEIAGLRRADDAVKAARPTMYRYETQLECMTCGRPIVKVAHASEIPNVGDRILSQRCSVCGGNPIRGETSSQFIFEVPEFERSPMGRPKRETRTQRSASA